MTDPWDRFFNAVSTLTFIFAGIIVLGGGYVLFFRPFNFRDWAVWAVLEGFAVVVIATIIVYRHHFWQKSF